MSKKARAVGGWAVWVVGHRENEWGVEENQMFQNLARQIYRDD